MAGNGPLERFYHPTGLHTVRNVPADDKPAVFINNGHQIHKSTLHGNIADIDLPHLFRPDNVQSPQQIWIFVGGRINDRGPRLTINRLNPRDLHQPANFVPAYQDPDKLQIPPVATCAPGRVFVVHAVHQLHDSKICLATSFGVVIIHRSVHPQQLTLPANTHLLIRSINHRLSIFQRY